MTEAKVCYQGGALKLAQSGNPSTNQREEPMLIRLKESVEAIIEQTTLHFPITESQAQRLLALAFEEPSLQEAIISNCDLILRNNDDMVPQHRAGNEDPQDLLS